MMFFVCCDPAGIRTQDPYIKSVMLYQLSYGIVLPRTCSTPQPSGDSSEELNYKTPAN